MRAFLAVELAADVHARVVAFKHELARHGAAVRWVRDDALHITIKFLAAVSEDVIEAMRVELAAHLVDRHPLDAVVSGVGVFPDWRRPRVVWIGVECAELAGIARLANAAAARVGVAADTRPFVPHLTLGRVRSTRGWTALEADLRAGATQSFGRSALRALSAVRSDLRPDGAVYTTRWSIPFGA